MKSLAPALAALFLLSTPLALAQPTGREQLRDALTDYYAHVITEKLELSDRQATKLRPSIDDLLNAQREEKSLSRGIQRRLQESLRSDSPDPDEIEGLVLELLDTEAGASQRLQSARRDLISDLKPHQQASFLLSEGEYRQAVMAHLRELRTGEKAPERKTREDSPWRRERKDRGERQAGSDEARQADLRENLTLLLAFQVRNHARVPLEQVIDLLPRLETAVQAQLDLTRLERTGKQDLRASLDSDAKAAELKQQVAELLDEQAVLNLRLHEARRAVVDGLEPVAAARYLQLQERFRQDAPKRLRMMQRMMSGEEETRPRRERTGVPNRGRRDR